MISKIKSKKVIELYEKTLSTRKVASILKMGRGTIRKILNENNIKIMDKEKAMRIANTKHDKISFSQDENEKAYLIGLITGDIHARKKSKYTLRLTSATTHRAFIDMFEKAFSQYGKVFVYPIKNRYMYQWNLTVDLDLKSFSFLLKKQENLDLMNEDNFISFLAGFIDTDGSLIIRKVRDNFQYVVKIFNQNKTLLEDIKYKLESLKITSGIYLNARKGETRKWKDKTFVYNKDYYCLEICRRKDVIKLLRILPLGHSEKIRKRDMILNVERQNIKHWNKIENLIKRLRDEIKIETKQTIDQARIKYEKRNISPLHHSTGN